MPFRPRLEDDPITERKKEWFVYLPAPAPTVHRPNPTGTIYGPFREGTGGRQFAELFVAKRGGTILGPFDPKKRPARGRAMEEKLNKTAKTPEMIAHMLKELESPAKRLTSWELGFVESLADQFERRRSLSDRQFEILERIYADRTA